MHTQVSVTEWDSKGCEVCRKAWQTGRAPPEIAVDLAAHASLHVCRVCGTHWEQHERFADVISADEARRRYPVVRS
jgi:hypothetical protein